VNAPLRVTARAFLNRLVIEIETGKNDLQGMRFLLLQAKFITGFPDRSNRFSPRGKALRQAAGGPFRVCGKNRVAF